MKEKHVKKTVQDRTYFEYYEYEITKTEEKYIVLIRKTFIHDQEDGREKKLNEKRLSKIGGNVSNPKLIAIIEPLREISGDTNMESLCINIYKDSGTDKDVEETGIRNNFINEIPYGCINTNILKMERDLPNINMYGVGLSKLELEEMRKLTENNYRALRIKSDLDSVLAYIDEIAKELYSVFKIKADEQKNIENSNQTEKSAAQKKKTVDPAKKVRRKDKLLHVPVSVFNEVFDSLYLIQPSKEYEFENSIVRRAMKKKDYIRGTTKENSCFVRFEDYAGKYIVFKEENLGK